MRTSQYLLSTLKKNPKEAEVISHQLMLRSGMIRKMSLGLYNWLPTGIRVLRKIENIIREEMNRTGAMEISMPIVQQADLWKKSGRWEKYGAELLRFIDRSQRYFVLGPTNEEVISDLISNEVRSYKQLPLNLYQIQTKFRDEIRPRFGVMRSREFIMKDAYSFHKDKESLQQTYDAMYTAYSSIFKRIGLNFKVVQADTGSIGGNTSHEFQALANSGEDNIVFSNISNYAANIELAEAICIQSCCAAPTENLRLVDTPDVKTISELISKYNIPIEKTIKIFVVDAKKNSGHQFVALLIRGDHQLNKIKAEKHPIIASPLRFATEKEIYTKLKLKLNSLGPINLPIPIIIDRSVAVMSDFSAGANIEHKHYFGINWKRDLPLSNIYDLRNVIEGDLSPDGKGILKIKRGIEIGHIFQLGTKYSKAMNVKFQNKFGYNQKIMMGCYGIGITRIIGAVIEQNHDDKGIIWPDAIAPFQVAILPINMYNSTRVKEIAEKLYYDLLTNGIDVLFDDRKVQSGIMFAEMDLIGIPHIIVISDRNLDNNEFEYKQRNYHQNNEKKYIKLTKINDFLKTLL
ncbi:Proline--tRNA ligase [Candidatus Arsenophonus lipoptenae]|uniref:Proline--tRNA ligase n=1 Tax=Candidatus Arsenophonus lipoptenae TaxID=634113 RepID=A0A0X9VEC1_9GAMM|nr:proline--tRNA ligase [Candidatus Arsenophonus lipoptenae]AMA64959.1 Proline--tRNA ligase [Candidatus Arsenophonus lipoptenae]